MKKKNEKKKKERKEEKLTNFSPEKPRKFYL